MSPALVTVPAPPAFLDPLTQIENCYYYAVPKFFGQNHPSTRWLITMIRNNEDDRLKHKMEISPSAFKGVYYQMIDCPQMYNPEDVAASPMFKKQAVVYLSPLGMAIYLGNAHIVELLLTYKDIYDEPLCDPSEPQYATHLQDNEAGDFHAFPPYLVMMRRSCFACTQVLLKAGWDPSQGVAMPMRRKFERRVLYFRDWLEVALSVLASRPMYPLQSLLLQVTKSTDYAPVRMPLEQFAPPTPAEAQPVGLIGVEELPNGVNMVGVRSLLDMAEHYDRYLQMRECAREVAALKREASAVGINPEVLMIQAQDFDGGALPATENPDNSNARRGFNNSSVASDVGDQFGPPPPPSPPSLNVNMSASKKKKDDDDPQYVSEGCRILHYALFRDPHGKSMQICMEAFCVLLRRGFYLLPAKPAPTSSLARDVRNTAALMLNLIQREQDKVDKIVAKIKSGVKKFAHLEEHKQLENRKTACIQYINKLVGILTKLLLQTKIAIDFIQAEFPPFPASSINFPLNPYLAQKFQDIKFGVIQEFNSTRDAWVYLDKETLQVVSSMSQMQLHFKVGKTPTIPPKKKGNKNKSNMSNTNSCFVSYTRVQRKPKRSCGQSSTLAASSSNSSFVRAVTGEARSEAASDLPIDDSSTAAADGFADEENIAKVAAANTGAVAAASDLPQVAELSNLMATSTETVAGLLLPTAAKTTTAGTESAASAPSLDGDVAGEARQEGGMEHLLASLCREVDSLFRPLEGSVGAATATSHRATELSTMEPELAPTPMPTPEPSPRAAKSVASAAAAKDEGDAVEQEAAGDPLWYPLVEAAAAAEEEDETPVVQQPHRQRKLKRQSGVLRLLSRFSSAKEAAREAC